MTTHPNEAKGGTPTPRTDAIWLAEYPHDQTDPRLERVLQFARTLERELSIAELNYEQLKENDGHALVLIWVELIKAMNVGGVVVKQASYNFTHVLAAAQQVSSELNKVRTELAALQARCAELERELKASAQSLETLTTTTSDPALKVWVGNIAASHRALLATKEPDKGKK